MKRTLLDMTQGILNTIDGDAVTSISDTVESLQVAQQIRATYFDLIDELQLPANYALVELQSAGDVNRPNVLKLPDNVARIIFFNYDKRTVSTDPTKYEPVQYLKPEDFVAHCNRRDSTDLVSNFIWWPVNTPDVKLTISKVGPPVYYTTFDDELLVFDSFDSNMESTMQSSKTQAYCEIRPVFQMVDSFVPDLPENLFTLLYNSAENKCYFNSKQDVSPLINQSEGRSRVRAQRNKYRQELDQNKWANFPDYGRRRP